MNAKPESKTSAAATPTGPLSLAVVGAGGRFNAYNRKYIVKNPDRVRIVAIAEPMAERRDAVAKQHAIPPDHCFESYEQIAARPGLARAVLNSTMDLLHYESSMALLAAGYDMLLEKPIAPTEDQVRAIIEASRRLGRTVMICHGIRYSPFYYKIKQLLDGGRIGRVMSIAASEYVGYDHMAGAFVRGNWRNTDVAAPMILAKCCHDLDMIVWLMEGIRPARVSSLGSLMHFREENAPPGSGTRCMNDCEIEPDCDYSAHTLYMGRVDPELKKRAGPTGEIDDATVAENLRSLRTDSLYGRCVWRCDNNVVDHQVVTIEFENGALGTLHMIGNAARATRDIHIVGTEGELMGDLKEGLLRLRKFRPNDFHRRYTEQIFDIPFGPDNHGGNDERLIADFVALMLGEPTSKARTRVEDSLTGHQVTFAAEQARLARRTIEL